MKKVLYIFVIGFGMLAVSCQKQDVTPVSGDFATPTWDEGNARVGAPNPNDDPSEVSSSNDDDPIPVIDDESPVQEEDITDPNKPTEGSKNNRL